MKFEKAVCPYCGAALKVEPDQRSIECEYCRAVVLISGHRQADEADSRRQSDGNAGKADAAAGKDAEIRREYFDNTTFADAQKRNAGESQKRNAGGSQARTAGRRDSASGPWDSIPGPEGRTVGPRSRTSGNKETSKSWKGFAALFPPPGFRSKDVPHMILAVIGYLGILGVACGMGDFKDAFFWTIASLSVVDLCTDWTGFYSRLPGVGSTSRLVRVLTKTFWGFVIFLAWITIMVLLDSFI